MFYHYCHIDVIVKEKHLDFLISSYSCLILTEFPCVVNPTDVPISNTLLMMSNAQKFDKTYFD